MATTRCTPNEPRPAGRARSGVLTALALCALASAGCIDVAGPDGEPAVTRQAIRFETDAGAFTVLLYPEAAPRTVALMLDYVREQYFHGREFQRVVPGHVIQVTDGTPNGATEDERRVPVETSLAHHFAAGAAGIARDDDPNSGGPEIFFMDFATSHLHGNYTVWGQVVEGLDVVHRMARAAAVDFPRLPDATPRAVADEFPYLFDRRAVVPPRIESTSLIDFTMSVAQAAQYPTVVGRNVRVDAWRHSLEWPADLAPGQPSQLTWYVRAYDVTVPPGPSAVRIHVAGEVLPVVGKTNAPGTYTWTWTPPAPGDHEVRLVSGGRNLATMSVLVP